MKLQAFSFLIASAAIVPQLAIAQPYTLWIRTYDESKGYAVTQASDDCYVVAGSLGEQISDVLLIKTLSNGDSIWVKNYGGPGDDAAYSVASTSDGGYVAVGMTEPYRNADEQDVYVLRTDALGDTLWTRTYGGENEDIGYSVAETYDGGYIVAGRYGSTSDVYLIRIDPDGDSLWTRLYGGEDTEYGFSIVETADSGYAVAGWTKSFGSGEWDVYLVRTDSIGDTLWTRAYGGPQSDMGYSVAETPDGGFIVAGWTESFGAGYWDLYLIKTDANGDMLWTRTYGGGDNDYGYSVICTSDGGYIVAGSTLSTTLHYESLWLIKTDAYGDTLWTKTYTCEGTNYRGRSILQAPDGGYVVTGNVGWFSIDLLLVRLVDELPNVTVTLIPDSTVVVQGGSIGYTVEVTNNTEYDLAFEYWSDVYIEPGKPYKNNPVFGPMTVRVDAGNIDSAYVDHIVPRSAPFRTYTLCGRIGFPADDWWSEDCFEFTVVRVPWPMFHHDPQHTGRSPFVGTDQPTTVWNFSTREEIASSPAVSADGTIYVGSDDNNLYALNPDGSLKWTFRTDHDVVCTPALSSDGTIYVGSTDGKLYALRYSGSLKWSLDTGQAIYSSPAVSTKGTIYIGSFDHKLYAIDPDGSVKWNYETDGFIQSSPAIGIDGCIYVGSYDRRLYAVNPNGTLYWSFPTNGSVISSPAVSNNGSIYVGSNDGRFYALRPDGVLRWSYKTRLDVYCSPAVSDDGTIYVGSLNHRFYALNPNGSLKWSYDTIGEVHSSPAIGADGTIYVYVGTYDHQLYAINPDGSLKWVYTTDTGGAYGAQSSPAIGADGTIYVGSFDNDLYAISHIPDVTVTVIPDSTIVEQGGTLGYTIEIVNNTDKDYTFEYWSDIYLWTGEPYKKNPVFGPMTVRVNAGKTRSEYITHKIPGVTPLKTFTLCGRIGVHPESVWDEGCFEFTVVEGTR
jgi:outer membrane protein assembly factor BamB